jgi:hypothetical protein
VVPQAAVIRWRRPARDPRGEEHGIGGVRGVTERHSVTKSVAERHTSAWLFGVLRAEGRPSPGGDGLEREALRFRPQPGPGEETKRERQTVGRQVDVLH